MKKNNKGRKAISLLLVSGMLLGTPAVNSEAAVITSNATDKTAVAFHARTAYSAGDYVTYDGELYICAKDTQGAWSSTAENFMQLTKNHELGKSGELSAVYADSADPSKETSLMAFAANVWQKLKVYLGTENRAAETDSDHYKSASVSAKLNFLEKQNEDLDENLTKLEKDVKDSFQSVSNGKSLLANTITGRDVEVRPSDSFQQFNEAILNMAQLEYDKGYTKGKDAGIQEADKQVNKNSASYAAGIQEADGRVNTSSASYTAGMQEADGRVNTDSASYKQGLKDSGYKTYTLDVNLDYDGPEDQTQSELFTSQYEYPSIEWTFQKEFTGNTILGVYVTVLSESGYGNNIGTELAVNVDGEYKLMSSNYGNHANGGLIKVTKDTLTWDGFRFYDSYKEISNAHFSIAVIYI